MSIGLSYGSQKQSFNNDSEPNHAFGNDQKLFLY